MTDLSKIELDKIIEMLCEKCSNEATRQMARKIEPLTERDLVLAEQEKTGDAFRLSIKNGSPSFFNFTDVRGYLKLCKQGGKISTAALLEIKKLLMQAESLSGWYSDLGEGAASLDLLFSQVVPLTQYYRQLDTSIMEDGKIADAASPALLSIRQKIARAGIKLRDTLKKMTGDKDTQKYLQDTNITLRDGRYVLPVKAEYRGQVAGLIHDTSATGQTIFIEPIAVVEANNEIRILEAREQEETERIIAELCARAADYSDIIELDFLSAAELCLYFAKAALAIDMKAYPPVISEENVIDLKKARHPLLDPKKAVPIDISIGRDYNILLITGPNTGGKTVSLKTCGLLTAMAMCGFMIPAAEGSCVPVVSNILCDIGDKQSIEASLSTFSSHMTTIAKILETADENSLVLLDEPGTGTDPVEGAALAQAVFEELKSRGTLCLATTHYQELKIYASAGNGVENASCEFDDVTFKPTYRLLIGQPGKSNAFAIAAGLGIADSVIDYAKNLIGTENSRFEEAVARLSKQQAELDKKLAKAAEDGAAAEKLRKELEEEKAEIEERRTREIERAKGVADQIIQQTKAQSNALIDELETIKKEKNKENFAERVSGAKFDSSRTLNKMYDTANPAAEEKEDNYVLPRELKDGDTVFVKSLGQEGTVSGRPTKSAVYVKLGLMRSKVRLSDVRLVEGEKPKQPNRKERRIAAAKKAGSSGTKPIARKGAMEVDLRGMASDEGVYEMEAFIDRAYLSGIHIVTIIHGKGTGVLRDACRKRLRSMKNVKSFRPGAYGEGEDGVTVVELG